MGTGRAEPPGRSASFRRARTANGTNSVLPALCRNRLRAQSRGSSPGNVSLRLAINPEIERCRRVSPLAVLHRPCRRHRQPSPRIPQKTAAPATDQHLQPQPRAAPSPPEELELDERRQRVLAALRSLPNEYRQPLVLRYLNDADYQTIARELSISNGSLRGLLSRGMKLLRDKLKQEKEAL